MNLRYFTALVFAALLGAGSTAQPVSFKTFDLQPVPRAGVVNFSELGPEAMV